MDWQVKNPDAENPCLRVNDFFFFRALAGP